MEHDYEAEQTVDIYDRGRNEILCRKTYSETP